MQSVVCVVCEAVGVAGWIVGELSEDVGSLSKKGMQCYKCALLEIHGLCYMGMGAIMAIRVTWMI